MLENIPKEPGVYFIFMPQIDKGYIGESNCLSRRIQQHFSSVNGKTFIKNYHEKYKDTQVSVLQVTKELSINERKEIERQYKEYFKFEGVNLINKLPSDKIENEWFCDRKAVLQFDKEGNLINKWDSIFSASKKLKFDVSSVVKACKGKIKSCKDFIWVYESEYSDSLLKLKIEESKQAIFNKGKGSRNRKGIPRNNDFNIKSVKLNQYDLDGNLIKIWESGYLASLCYKTNSHEFYRCALGKRQTVYNTIFLFEGDCIKTRLEEMYQLYQFDFEGNLIGKYFGPKHAESKLNIRADMISNAAKLRRVKYAGNFIWIYKSDYTEKLLQERLNLVNRIGCFKDEILIKRFSSIKESLDFLGNDISDSSLLNCLNGWSKTSGGYMWKYLT